jgi:hypothetical protein
MRTDDTPACTRHACTGACAPAFMGTGPPASSAAIAPRRMPKNLSEAVSAASTCSRAFRFLVDSMRTPAMCSALASAGTCAMGRCLNELVLLMHAHARDDTLSHHDLGSAGHIAIPGPWGEQRVCVHA